MIRSGRRAVSAHFDSASFPSEVDQAATPAVAQSGAPVASPTTQTTGAPDSFLPVVLTWLLVWGASAVFYLGIPALVGLTLGGGR